MRPALLLGGMVGVLTTALSVAAQAPLDRRTITVAEVQVRSGPSDKFYPTSKLVRGEVVEVVPQPPGALQPGWLAIKPPRGSFSWINQRFVQVTVAGRGIVVSDSDVPLLVGSSETSERPTKEGVKAARGSQVVILDKANYTDNGVWLPVMPQPAEVRYIPEAAVQAGGIVPTVAANLSQGARSAANVPPGGTPAVAPAPASRGTDLRDEERRSLQRAADLETDPARRTQLLQMVANLPPPSAAAQQPGYPGNALAGVNIGGNAGAGSTSLYNTGNQAGGQPGLGAAKWSDYGELRRTAFREADGRPVYALVDKQGRPALYATPLNNLSLEPYVGRRLSMYGPMTYNPTERCQVMTVSHVAPLAPLPGNQY
jgi:uncharacterized protein YraI